MKTGKILRKLREAKGLTQEELGRIINQTKSNISKYENGKLEINLDVLSALAGFFGVTTDYLLGRTDVPTPPQAKDEPSHEEYVLDVRTLADAAIRIANLFNENLIDEEEYLRLNTLAVKKFPLKPTKGSPRAAHLAVDKPGTGVFEEKE